MTRRLLQRLLRLMFPAISCACGAAAMLLFLHPAHAEPLVDVTPTGIDLSWQGWMLAILAGIGGALKILDVLLAGLKWLAPRTDTTLDDRARDEVQIVDAAAHGKLDAILKVVGGLVPASGVPATPATAPAGPVLVKGTGTTALLACLLLGALATPTLTGCASVRPAAAAGVVAAFDCEAAHLDAATLADLKGLAADKVQGWIAGTAGADMGALIDRVKADLALFRSDAGHCAVAAALAAATTAIAPAPPEAGTAVSALSAAGPDPVALRLVFEAAAHESGWQTIKVAGGTVL